MKKEIMEKWVDALRSGEYKQGKHSLNDGYNYCCLGVLCELAAKQNVCEIISQDGYFGYDNKGCFSGDELLPISVIKWSEMKSDSGRIDTIGEWLTNLNDIGTSFSEIADIIEKHYEEL